MKKVILSLVVIVALFSCLEANPFTLPGEMRAPDAYILPHRAGKVQLTSYIRKETSKPNTDFEGKFFGLMQVGFLNRLELGLMYGDKVTLGNVKVKLIDETVTYPQLAVGIDNLFSKIGKDFQAEGYTPPSDMIGNPDNAYYEKNSFYVAASKQTVVRGLAEFIPEFSTVVSGGIGFNRFKGQVPRSKQFEGVFASAEVSPHPNVIVQGEYDGHNINLGVRYNLTLSSPNDFSIKLGYLGFEESLKKDNPNHRLALGFSYVYDKLSDARKRPIMPDSPLYGGPGTATGTQLTKPRGDVSQSTSDLFEELKRLRESREQTQKVLEDLRKQLQELEAEAGNQ